MAQKPKIGKKSPKAGFVSLGCAKALVDIERLITRLHLEDYDGAGSLTHAGA
jgi:ribosomal protein S12 methylthiotransferase